MSVAFLVIIAIIGEWKLFEKCGEKKWKSLIPFYNDWTLLDISGCHRWYFLIIIFNTIFTLFVEIISKYNILQMLSGIIGIAFIYVIISINYNIAKKFRKGIWFALGMSFIPFVFYLLLGFSKKYKFNKKTKVSLWGIYDFEEKKSFIKTDKKYCSKCGQKIISDFCPKCGKSKKGE